MAEDDAPHPGAIAGHPASEAIVAVQGAGSLAGRLQLDPRVDLTRPIFAQVLALEGEPEECRS